MITNPARRSWRRVRAGWRDTLLLLREFRRPLLLFTVAIAGSGWLMDVLSNKAGQPLSGLVEAMYVTLTLTFLQPVMDFPSAWYLQVFFFLMPLVGIGIFAQGLTDFGTLLFNRRARGKEWEMAVASTFNDHVVVVGLGHLGFRVVKRLDDFAASLQSQFGFYAMSATGMAAPLFASIAAHIDMTSPINIAGQPHILANVQVGPVSRLLGNTILDIEEKYHLSVVMLCRDGMRVFHPAGTEAVQPGQTIAVFGEPDRISLLLNENHR